VAVRNEVIIFVLGLAVPSEVLAPEAKSFVFNYRDLCKPTCSFDAHIARVFEVLTMHIDFEPKGQSLAAHTVLDSLAFVVEQKVAILAVVEFIRNKS
jgi:hypothetical protein